MPRHQTSPKPCCASPVKRQEHRASPLTSRQVRQKAQSKAAEQVSGQTEEEALRLRRAGWPTRRSPGAEETQIYLRKMSRPLLLWRQLPLICQLLSLAASSYVPSPTGDMPGTGREVPGGSSLPAATLLNGSCLQLLTCLRTNSTGLSHALQNTTPRESTKLGMSKTALCQWRHGSSGSKNSLETILPFCP